jgi:hypothetical protein
VRSLECFGFLQKKQSSIFIEFFNRIDPTETLRKRLKS